MRGGPVPVGRRSLLARPGRLAAAAGAIGLAVMLVLLLDGLWAGLRAQVTTYEDRAGADLFVVSPGTQNLFSDGSTIPLGTAHEVANVRGVRWVAPVRGMFSILDLHGGKVAASVIGYRPGGRGGPWSLAEGRRPRADDEVVVDAVMASRHGLSVGSRLTLLGKQLRVVGMSEGTAAFMTGFVFVTHQATDKLLRSPGTTSFLLVGADRPAAVENRLSTRGYTVLARDSLRESNLSLATQVYGRPVRLMVAVAFVAGILLVALTAYAHVSDRRREYGVLAALGATKGRLVRLAVGQTLGLTAAGLVAGLLLFLAVRGVLGELRPQFSVLLTSGSLARAVLAALVMGLLGALVPARRVAAMEPTAAFRGPG